MNSEPLPLACDSHAIPADERDEHFARIRRLFGDVHERIDLSDGFAFRFPATAFEDVVRFVENERKCCPFLAFAIELAPGRGPVWLRLTGPEGTREFLRSELPLDAGSDG